MKPLILVQILFFAPWAALGAPASDDNRLVLSSSKEIDEAAIFAPFILATRTHSQGKRAQNQDNCEKCTKKKCGTGKYRDNKDCQCKRCGPNKKPNAAQDGCVPDSGNQQCDVNKCSAAFDEYMDTKDCTCKKCASGKIPHPTKKDHCIDEDSNEGMCDMKCGEKGKYRDQKDCSCKTCPRGKKPAPDDKSCVSDGTGDSDKRQKEKDRRFQERLKDWVKEYKEKKAEKKQKQFELREADYRKQYQKEKEERERKERDREANDKKKSRLMQCLLLTSVIMPGSDFMLATGYFTEAYAESDLILEHWPGDIAEPGGSDEYVTSDEYLVDFLQAIPETLNDLGPEYTMAHKREQMSDDGNTLAAIDGPSGTTTSELEARSVSGHPQHREKRFLQLIAKAIEALVKGVKSARGKLTGAKKRYYDQLDEKGGLRVSKDNKKKPDEQHESSKKVADHHNFKRCLKGEKPKSCGGFYVGKCD